MHYALAAVSSDPNSAPARDVLAKVHVAPPYQFGYVGAFPQHGFASVSLFAIAEEFSAAMGDAFADLQLAQWWAFVYDTKLPGTDIHGDDADYSLNIWITPDSANLEPSSGGLILWDTHAPADWSYGDCNSGGEKLRQFLTFAPGFENRRRSVTMLFRRRKKPSEGVFA